MNNDFKIRKGWSKHVLRAAMAGLVPDNILWRKGKLGFESPQQRWIDAIRPAMQAAIARSAILNCMCSEQPDVDRLDAVTFWKLYSIAKWEEVYAVRLPAPPDEPRARPAQGAADIRITPPAPASARVSDDYAG